VKKSEIALLATIRGARCISQDELEALVGGPIQSTLEALSAEGLVDHGQWSQYAGRELDEIDDWRYTLSTKGQIALKVIDGRICDWCHRKAVEGRPLKRGGTFVFFCRRHFEIGWESAETEPSSKGSLHGLIVSGKIKPRLPDEVAV
jgi:hypothetical protein